MSRVLEPTARRLHAVLAAEQARARVPSLGAGLVRDGALAWAGHHGTATGGPEPGPDLRYRIGSITKTMTAVLVLQLRDEGLVDLADPLGRHLPGVGYADRSLRSLLSHASGMQAEPPGEWWERSPGVTFDRLASGVDDSDGPFADKMTYHYSNLAYGLLGELVARLRGDSWWSQVRARILEPLGMTRTCFHPEPPHATGYSVHHFAGTLTEEPAQDTGAMAAAGQLWSTVTDLGRFASFLIDGDRAVLSASSVEEMTVPQIGTAAGGLASGYGLGVRLLPGGSGTLVGHTGSMPGFLAGLLVDRVRRTGAVCLANGTAGLRVEPLLVDLLAELEHSEPTVVPAWTANPEPPAQVAEVLGLWHWGNTALAFGLEGEEVVVTALGTGATVARLRPDGPDAFVGTVGYHHGERMRVVRDPDGRINHLVCATFVYTRLPYDPRAPIPGGAP